MFVAAGVLAAAIFIFRDSEAPPARHETPEAKQPSKMIEVAPPVLPVPEGEAPEARSEKTSAVITVRDAVSGHTLNGCAFATEEGQQISCDSRGLLLVDTTGKHHLGGDVSAPGYSRKAFSLVLSVARTTAEVLLTRGASLSGVVVDGAQHPVAGAIVLARPINAKAETELGVPSDNEGRFELQNITPGPTEVEAELPGERSLFGRIELSVSPGEHRSNLRIVMDSGGRVEGVVVNADGSPADDLESASFDCPRRSGGKGATGDAFVLDGVPPGVCTILAGSRSHGRAALSGVTIRSGQTTSVKLVLASAILDGFVHDSRGSALAGVSVSVALTSGKELGSTTSAPSGAFHFSGLPDGPFRVRASQNTLSAEVSGVKVGTLVDLVLRDTGALQGVVVDGAGHPAATCSVRVVARGRVPGLSGPSSTGRTASACTFRFETMAPGTYDIVASASGKTDGHATTSVEEGRTSEVTIHLGDGATVNGRVLRDGRPVAECVVGIGAITSSDGAFELPGLADGHTHLTAMCPEGFGGGTDITVQGGRAGGDVTINVSTATHETPPLADFGGIGATLRTEDGYPAVMNAMQNTPAELAGLQAGDVLLSVDGESTSGVPLNDVIGQIRGEAGSSVTLTVRRPGVAAPFEVELERRRIVVP
jgi:hypothetical protein